MTFFEGKPPPDPGPTRVRPHGNLAVLRIAIVVLFAIVVVRLADMQLVRGEDYAERARHNHIQSEQILPARGLIYDAQGRPLVENVGFYQATIVPELLPESEEDRRVLYQYLEELLDVPYLESYSAVVQAETEGTENQGIAIKANLSRDEALLLREVESDMPGISVTIQPGRNYVGGETFSPLLGYIGLPSAEEWPQLRDEGYQFNQPVGKMGIELEYERLLRGEVGWSSNEVNAFGDVVNVLQTEEPEPGRSLRMSIDMDLQEYIAEALEEGMDDEATTAAAVVMDVETGAVRGIVSIPTWDNNMFSQADLYEEEIEALLDDPRRPLINRALNPAAPGSTFKLVTALAALEEGAITPNTTIEVDSMVRHFEGDDGVLWPLWDWAVHGTVDLHRAISVSSNHYFYMASCGLQDIPGSGLASNVHESAYRLRYYATRMGYGDQTGIDTGAEAAGIIPDPEWKRETFDDPMFNPEDREWYYGDTCWMGIGQGDVTATPMQVTQMTAAIANNGRLVRPRTVWEVLRPDGSVEHTYEPEWEDVPVSEENLHEVRQGMRRTITDEDGAGRRARVEGLEVAGKTGTAEFTHADGRELEHAWFTGYYPYSDPEVAVTVFFDIGVGGERAAPVAGQILEYYDELQGEPAVRGGDE